MRTFTRFTSEQGPSVSTLSFINAQDEQRARILVGENSSVTNGASYSKCPLPGSRPSPKRSIAGAHTALAPNRGALISGRLGGSRTPTVASGNAHG